MKARQIGQRVPFVLALAAALTWLVLQSSLLRLLQSDITPGAWAGWIYVGALLALTPALFAAGSPLPATLAVTTPVILAAAYGASHLEWLKTLKEFNLVEGPGFASGRLAVSLLALALAWGMHVLDAGARLGADARERGIDPAQADAARRVVWMRGARVGGLALAAALALGVIALVASAVFPGLLPAQGVSFIAPLAAAALLGVAALLVLGVRKKDAPPTADDDGA